MPLFFSQLNSESPPTQVKSICPTHYNTAILQQLQSSARKQSAFVSVKSSMTWAIYNLFKSNEERLKSLRQDGKTRHWILITRCFLWDEKWKQCRDKAQGFRGQTFLYSPSISLWHTGRKVPLLGERKGGMRRRGSVSLNECLCCWLG